MAAPEIKLTLSDCHPYSSPPHRIQLTLRATHRARHGALGLEQANFAWSFKPRMLRPGTEGIRGSMVIRLRPCMISSTSIISSTPPSLSMNSGLFRASVSCTAVPSPTRFVSIPGKPGRSNVFRDARASASSTKKSLEVSEIRTRILSTTPAVQGVTHGAIGFNRLIDYPSPG